MKFSKSKFIQKSLFLPENSIHSLISLYFLQDTLIKYQLGKDYNKSHLNPMKQTMRAKNQNENCQ